MIRVVIERSAKDRTIRAFTVEGHAGYAQTGKDIVCAGVSAVTVGTVNAVESLLGLELPSEMEEGLLRTTVPVVSDIKLGKDVQLLLESMVVMLQSIEESYGSYMILNENFA